MESTCLRYQRPPFNAKNIVELSKVIKNQDIDFPNSIQKISPMSQKLIRSMLKVNPKDRISW
jgi:serine/threonine protein kinase